MIYTVSTRDVDGGTRRKYKTLPGARKRFESMLGYTMESAIDEQFFALRDAGKPVPAADSVEFVRGVSMYGTVVEFYREGA